MPRVKAPIHLEPHATPTGEIYTVEYSPRAVDSIMMLPIIDRPATAVAAAEYHLSMPPKMTVMPHLIPAKNITQVSVSDSLAIFSFEPVNGPMKGRLTLRKVMRGADSTWIVEQVESLHPTP